MCKVLKKPSYYKGQSFTNSKKKFANFDNKKKFTFSPSINRKKNNRGFVFTKAGSNFEFGKFKKRNKFNSNKSLLSKTSKYPKFRFQRTKFLRIDKKFNLCLWIRQTYNNIFLTLTDTNGRVKFVISGGISKLRGNNRTSHRSVEIITKILINRLRYVKLRGLEFKTLCLFLVTPKNSISKTVLQLFSFIPKVKLIAARIRIPHNGIRLKKLRRLLLVYIFF